MLHTVKAFYPHWYSYALGNNNLPRQWMDEGINYSYVKEGLIYHNVHIDPLNYEKNVRIVLK